MTIDSVKYFSKKYRCSFGGQERYWEQAIVLADLSMSLAKEWGLIDYDYKQSTEWVLAQIGAIRRTVQENQVDAFDLMQVVPSLDTRQYQSSKNAAFLFFIDYS